MSRKPLGMTVCYNKLWKRLIDLKMSPSTFRKKIGIAASTLTQLRNDKVVSMVVLMKICAYLDCGVDDILDFYQSQTEEAEE